MLSTFLAALGQGMTLPYLFVYLTEVRHMDPTLVGVIVAWMGLLSLILGVPCGALIDRFGARRVILPLIVIEAIGVTSYGFDHNALQAFGSATLVAMGGAAIWSGLNTIMTTVTTDEERQHVFGLSFAILNLGIGAGGVAASFIADPTRASSFQILYAVNGVANVAPLLIIGSMRGVGGPIVEAHERTEAAHGGYREVFRNRAFRRFAIFAVVLMSCAYAQIEVGFPAFATTDAGVTPRVIGWALGANTATIVVAQLFVLKRIDGHSRSRVLGLVGAIIAASWVVLGLAAWGRAASPALAATGVVLSSAVFACGETMMSPVMPAMTNALATDELRGRYNAISSMTWGITGIIGPLTAAPLIGHHLGGLWLALVIAGALGAGTIALSLRRLLTPAQDGRAITSPILEGATPALDAESATDAPTAPAAASVAGVGTTAAGTTAAGTTDVQADAGIADAVVCVPAPASGTAPEINFGQMDELSCA